MEATALASIFQKQQSGNNEQPSSKRNAHENGSFRLEVSMGILSKELSLLYVDDEELAREVMTKILRLEGLSVLSAADGREALDLFKRHQPDIVVTDIRMPVMDGIAMSREIRRISCKTPIIIASAYLQEQCLPDLQSLGINSYIQKPIELKKLFSSIATCCNCLGNFPKPGVL